VVSKLSLVGGGPVFGQAGVAYKRFRRRLRCFALTVA
jgi:hypothetical protein